MRIVFTVLVLVVSCVTAGCAFQNLEIIGKGMDSFLGKNVNELVDQLGFPSEEKVVLNRKAYIWQISSTHLSPNTQTSTYSGTVGSKSFFGTANTIGGVTAMPVSCKLTVEIDSEDRIIYWIGEGSEFGCEIYAQRFKKH